MTAAKKKHGRAMGRVELMAGMPVILLGFVCYALSGVFERGFVHGLFQGATIALMVLGAYLVGAGLWHSRTDEAALDEGAHWLPSRDSTPAG